MHARRGFTLIEILVVMTIIAILTGFLLTGIAIVMRREKTARTLMRIEALTKAVDLYLGRYNILKGTAYDIGTEDMHDYFGRLYELVKLNESGKVIVRLENGEESTYAFVEDKAEGTHLLDCWGYPILLQVTNDYMPGLVGKRAQTTRVLIRSKAGTEDPHYANDIIQVYDHARRNWFPGTMIGIDEDGHWDVELKY